MNSFGFLDFGLIGVTTYRDEFLAEAASTACDGRLWFVNELILYIDCAIDLA